MLGEKASPCWRRSRDKRGPELRQGGLWAQGGVRESRAVLGVKSTGISDRLTPGVSEARLVLTINRACLELTEEGRACAWELCQVARGRGGSCGSETFFSEDLRGGAHCPRLLAWPNHGHLPQSS